MNWESVLVSLVAALVGGAIAGYFTLRAVDKSYNNTLKLRKENDRDLIKGFLQALHDEIETLWDSYQTSIGVQLEALQDGFALLLYFPVMHDYFTVYNGNAFLIGRIEDADLRKLIVQVYSKSRGLLDSYRMNNDMLGKFDYWANLHKQTNNAAYEESARGVMGAMQIYAKKMKVSHNELKDLKEKLLRHLRKMGVLSTT